MPRKCSPSDRQIKLLAYRKSVLCAVKRRSLAWDSSNLSEPEKQALGLIVEKRSFASALKQIRIGRKIYPKSTIRLWRPLEKILRKHPIVETTIRNLAGCWPQDKTKEGFLIRRCVFYVNIGHLTPREDRCIQKILAKGQSQRFRRKLRAWSEYYARVTLDDIEELRRKSGLAHVVSAYFVEHLLFGTTLEHLDGFSPRARFVIGPDLRGQMHLIVFRNTRLADIRQFYGAIGHKVRLTYKLQRSVRQPTVTALSDRIVIGPLPPNPGDFITRSWPGIREAQQNLCGIDDFRSRPKLDRGKRYLLELFRNRQRNVHAPAQKAFETVVSDDVVNPETLRKQANRLSKLTA
ncbi:MAG: hypothetical protein HY554_07475 [Elusimicrobia bacterium]|nr:hypothetical protein [Elusimicrobiota bacterium]